MKRILLVILFLNSFCLHSQSKAKFHKEIYNGFTVGQVICLYSGKIKNIKYNESYSTEPGSSFTYTINIYFNRFENNYRLMNVLILTSRLPLEVIKSKEYECKSDLKDIILRSIVIDLSAKFMKDDLIFPIYKSR